MLSKKSLFQPVELKPEPEFPLKVSLTDEKLNFVGNSDRMNKFIYALAGKCFLTYGPKIFTVFGYINGPDDVAKMTPELASKVIQLLCEKNLITESEKTNFTAAVMPPLALRV